METFINVNKIISIKVVDKKEYLVNPWFYKVHEKGEHKYLITVDFLFFKWKLFKRKVVEVKPEYSSFVGNFLFRSLNLPDMCLAAFEIGRRTYEFYNQYIIKTKDIKKNIVFPDLQMYNSFLAKSLEEFGLETTFVNLLNQYNFFKKSKTMYRLSIDKFNL